MNFSRRLSFHSNMVASHISRQFGLCSSKQLGLGEGVFLFLHKRTVYSVCLNLTEHKNRVEFTCYIFIPSYTSLMVINSEGLSQLV